MYVCIIFLKYGFLIPPWSNGYMVQFFLEPRFSRFCSALLLVLLPGPGRGRRPQAPLAAGRVGCLAAAQAWHGVGPGVADGAGGRGNGVADGLKDLGFEATQTWDFDDFSATSGEHMIFLKGNIGI